MIICLDLDVADLMATKIYLSKCAVCSSDSGSLPCSFLHFSVMSLLLFHVRNWILVCWIGFLMLTFKGLVIIRKTKSRGLCELLDFVVVMEMSVSSTVYFDHWSVYRVRFWIWHLVFSACISAYYNL